MRTGCNRLLINGELVVPASGRYFPNIDPATEEVIGDAADAGAEDMERAVVSARRAFDHTPWRFDLGLRLRVLGQLQRALAERADELRPMVVAEGGAPLGLTYGPLLNGPIHFMRHYLETARNWNWQRELPVTNAMGVASRRLVWQEPVGVVAAITPWNVPWQINLAKVIPALAAGCVVILKSAPETPWAATELARIAVQYTDLPPGVLNVITGQDPAALGEQLVNDSRVDMVSFTGSTTTGRRVMALAANSVKKVFLELGGKSAHIVLDDVSDLQQALAPCMAVCFHAGQGCAITTRVLLPESLYEQGVEILAGMLRGIRYGDPYSSDQIMGPLISARQRERVLGYIKQGIEEGARLVCGGRPPESLERGFYVEPTLFADVDNQMRIAREEIFGPVLVAISYRGDAQAIQIANDSIYGLSGAIFSVNTERALAMARRIDTGTLNINGANFFDADAPFGGYKQSGLGREMGTEGFAEYLQTKTIALPA